MNKYVIETKQLTKTYGEQTVVNYPCETRTDIWAVGA